MKNALKVFGCTLLFLLNGCFIGDHWTPTEVVLLSFPTPKGWTGASLSVNDVKVQQALLVIDGVLTDNGFGIAQHSVFENEAGFVAGYVQYQEGFAHPIESPEVYFTGGRLEVFFHEGGHNSRMSPATRATIKSLRKELKNRYGFKNVKSD